MEHPKAVGDRTTLAVMLALTTLGYDVAVPFGENTRYDLIIDDAGTLRRVQCKTGRLRNGVILIRTSSSYAHHPSPKPRQRHYRGQVDAFAVYCRETAGVYLVPTHLLPLDSGSLRVDAPRNGQRKHIRDAAPHQLATISIAVEPSETARSSRC